MNRHVLLINTNIARPPVSPVGLEYVAQALIDAGVRVRVLDLSFETDWRASLRRELAGEEPLLVAVAVRNTDDCSFLSRKSFLPWLNEVVMQVKSLTGAKLVLGGGGFSTMPEDVMKVVPADFGIEGDGEEVLLALASSLEKGDPITSLPNLVYRRDGKLVRNPRAHVDLRRFPSSRRRVFDNVRYERFGAMVGVETKRGCSQKCIFCADPVAKGRKVRLRPPEIVAQEFRDLVEQGVSWFHLCDSEFNLPIGHAKDVCRALISEGIADRIRWYTYCAPAPFDRELASLMKKSGCSGINFGVDSLSDAQLRRLGKSHSFADVVSLVNILRSEGINYICDMLVGAPGETPGTVKTTIDRARKLNMPLVGIAAGVRVYPDTSLAQAVAIGKIREVLHCHENVPCLCKPYAEGGGKAIRNSRQADCFGLRPRNDFFIHSGVFDKGHGNSEVSNDAYQPLFYLSPALGDDVALLISRLVDNDPRFLVLAKPDDKGSYNYADDTWLSSLIEKGERGAYWDILRRNREGTNQQGSAHVP